MPINKHMPEHIRDTYLLLCGDKAEAVEDFIYLKYLDEGYSHPVTISCLINSNSLSDRARRSEGVIKLVFDPFNTYAPTIQQELFSDTDWTDYELDMIFK